MMSEEKINLLQKIEDGNAYHKQFSVLMELSFDEDGFVRSTVAEALVNCVTEESKQILLRLARDTDETVRTDAYDSMSVFPDGEILSFLENALDHEKDEMARSYAILSWADVLILLKSVTADKLILAKNMMQKENSDRCRLSWCYAQYILGVEEALDRLLLGLHNNDYQIRSTTLKLVGDIVNQENKISVKNAITELLITENTEAVRNCAEEIMDEID